MILANLEKTETVIRMSLLGNICLVLVAVLLITLIIGEILFRRKQMKYVDKQIEYLMKNDRE